MSYASILKKALDEVPAAQGLDRADLEARIAGITKQLKGPASNTERIMLCADRAALRKALDALPA